MPNVKLNARDLVVEVESAVALTWAAVESLTSLTVKMGEDEESADTTTFASQGIAESEPMQRGAGMDLEGLEFADSVTGVLAVGQARVTTLSGLVGSAAVARLRYRTKTSTTWTVWPVWFSGPETGGGTNDKSGWKTSAMRTGAASTMPTV